MSETIPDDLRETVEQIASDLEDIHFNSRHGSWLESAKHIIASALLAERLASTERAAKIAENVGNFGDYQRHELTADFGQPRYDMMVAIAAAIRSQP